MIAPTVSTSMCFVHPDKTLSIDASQIGRPGQPLFGQIYDDAADEGLRLISHKTGQEIRMAVCRTEKDREGDVRYWCLKSVPEDERRLRLPYSIELTIYNT